MGAPEPGQIVHWKVLLSAGLVLAGAWAEDRSGLLGRRFQKFEVRFQVRPDDSQISVGGVLLPAVAGAKSLYVLQPSQLGMDDPQTKVDFLFSRPGYASQTLPLNQQEVLSGPHAVQLQPNSLPGYWHKYPAYFVTLAGILAVAGLEGTRRYFLARRLERRHQKLAAFDASGSQRFDALVRSQVGRFRIVERLGSGGMASVYRALPDDTLDRQEQVAIKCIRPDQLTPSFVERFQREIGVLCKLDHPNILRVFDWGEQDGLPYLVTEVVEGVTLNRFLSAGGMSSEDFQTVCFPLMKALSYAHEKGVAHRDLKPSNVMVSPLRGVTLGRVKLMDFGLAKGPESEDLTLTGQALGTPAYIAPETLLGSSLDLSWLMLSDQYSLAIMLYEMLCGRRPFEHEDLHTMMMQRLHQPAPAIRKFRSELPGALEETLARMLARDPKERFGSIAQAGQALQDCLSGQNWETRLQASPTTNLEDDLTEEVQLNA